MGSDYQGRAEYPKWVYHAVHPAQLVATPEALERLKAKLGAGWAESPADVATPPSEPAVAVTDAPRPRVVKQMAKPAPAVEAGAFAKMVRRKAS